MEWSVEHAIKICTFINIWFQILGKGLKNIIAYIQKVVMWLLFVVYQIEGDEEKNNIPAIILTLQGQGGWMKRSDIKTTVKPVLSDHSKKRQKLVFKTDYRIAYRNTFDFH